MLSVIVDASGTIDRLTGLLAQLTAGAVNGLVREVWIVAPASETLDQICEATGAKRCDRMSQAAAAARYETLLITPADFRLRDGWIDALEPAGGEGVVVGLGRSRGVLVARGRAQQLADHVSLGRLRRKLGLWPKRLG
jgi:hypothetical protein